MQRATRWILIVLACAFTVACGSEQQTSTPIETAAESIGDAVNIEGDEQVDSSATVIDLAYFDSAGLVQDPTVVDCTLTDGTAAECAQLVVKYLPDNLEIGPFCPDNIYEDEGGIWEWDGENPGVYRLDEAFFTMLTEQGYEFYDADGNVYIGDPAGGLIADVNNCLEATADDTVEMTALIPLQPVMADALTDLGTVAQVGMGIDGVPIFADAPSVLQTGHLPALDVCGGHIDPGGWYHWHATATDIDSSFDYEDVDADCHLDQSASSLFGYAFDGYPIYGSVDQDGSIPIGLDACSGHISATAEYPDGVYHYHAGLEFPNLPTCLVGVSANNAFATTASAGVGAGGGPGGGPPPEGDVQAPPEDVTEGPETVDIGDGRLFAISGDIVFPEGVSYDEATGKFNVGSTSDGTLYVGDVNGEGISIE